MISSIMYSVHMNFPPIVSKKTGLTAGLFFNKCKVDKCKSVKKTAYFMFHLYIEENRLNYTFTIIKAKT